MKIINKIIYSSVALLLIIAGLSFIYKSSNMKFSLKQKELTKDIPIFNVADYQTKFDDDENKTIKLYENLNTAVVHITFFKTEYVRYFFDLYPQKSEGEGSGAFIDPRGYIVTNYHVVKEADKVTVTLSQDEGTYEAKIIGVDLENDLAVIKISNNKNNFNAIPLGSSTALKVGQKVYAIGNPFGLDRTLTTGIISGLGRPIKTDDGNIIESAIQTDASINPGNSGGPLIDSSGKMIGLNSMIISPSGGSVGLGFAIPVNTVKESVDELIKYGYVKRGWIDATFLPVDSAIAKELGYSVDYGVMVMLVARNGEAYNAGFRGGDKKALYGETVIYIGGELITGIDGIKIKDYSSLLQVLKNKKPGDTVSVEYYRKNVKFNTAVKLIEKRNFSRQNVN